MEINAHGQPEIGIHYKNNIAKKLNELIGVCKGIIANQTVNAKEFQYLHAWLRDNSELRKDPDYFDLLDITTDIAEKEYVDVSDLDDLLDLIECVLEFNCEANSPFTSADVAIGRLIGLARGLLSDGVVDDKEISYLSAWLDKCADFENIWPISEIKDDVANILKDGIITQDEKYQFAKKLQGLTGGDFFETGVTSGFSANFYCSELEYLDFVNKEFCLTGQFLYGSRAICQKRLVELGAVVSVNPRKTTDYLVVGSLSSRDWIQTSHGRKIEKAISLRDSGQSISLLHEDVWVKFLV